MTTRGKRVTGLTVSGRLHKGLKPPRESKYSLKVQARRMKEGDKGDGLRRQLPKVCAKG